MDVREIDELTNKLGQVYPNVVRLARLACLAARVEPALLRKLRVELLPDVDAGTERDLWFSTLVQSQSALALVLDPSALEPLRQSLAADQALLEQARKFVTQVHNELPPALEREEEIIYQAIRTSPDARTRMSEAINRIIRTMMDEPDRRDGLARWAFRAWPRLPAAAQGSTEWVYLLTLSGLFLRGTAQFVPSPTNQTGSAPVPLESLLPPNTGSVEVGVRLVEGGIEIGPKDLPDGHTISLPDIEPLWLYLEWTENSVRRTELVTPDRNRIRRIPVGQGDITIRTANGTRYILSPQARASARVRSITLEFPRTDSPFDLIFLTEGTGPQTTRTEFQPLPLTAGPGPLVPYTLTDIYSPAPGRGLGASAPPLVSALYNLRNLGGASVQSDVALVGDALYEGLPEDIQGKVLGEWVQVRENAGYLLRIRIKLQDDDRELRRLQLARLPWEYLSLEGQRLALHPRCSLLRVPVEGPIATPPLPPGQPAEGTWMPGPLRVLLVISDRQVGSGTSNPRPWSQAGIDEEVAAIQEALAPALDRGSVQLTQVRNVTVEAFKSYLAGGIDLFHFIGYHLPKGGRAFEDAILPFSGTSGQTVETNALSLTDMVRSTSSNPLKLIMLNSCETVWSAYALSRVADAVIGTQGMVTDKEASAFSRAFYGALARGLPVDQCVGEARRSLAGEARGPDPGPVSEGAWGSYILLAHSNPVSLIDPNAEFPTGDEFSGTSRAAARSSIADAPIEDFADLQDLVATLPSAEAMARHEPPITEDAQSNRVAEEERNVRLRVWLYAAARQISNDFYLIIGRDPNVTPRMYMIAVVSGLPQRTDRYYEPLKVARDAYKGFFPTNLPGQQYSFYNPPIPLQIEGSLYFPINRVGSGGSGGSGRAGPTSFQRDMPTIWEIHPISKIVFEP